MRFKKILWIIALLLVLFLVTRRQDKTGEETLEGTFGNCYMISLIDEKMTVFVDGKQWILSCPVGKEVVKNDKIVDIVVKQGQVKKVVWKEGLQEDQVEAVEEKSGWVILKKQGNMNLSTKIQCYIKDQDGVRQMTNMGSLLNWDKVLCYIHENQIEAIVADGEQNKTSIKVLLHGTENEIYHKEVRIAATEKMEIKFQDQSQWLERGRELSLGELTEFSKSGSPAGQENRRDSGSSGGQENQSDSGNSDRQVSEKQIAKTTSCELLCENGKIRILSMNTTAGTPEYRGKIRVTKTKKGYILVNELPLEEYLYSVVSSEMPSSYPKEALKAQAICARTYALYQMQQAYYSAYGAHVDDTVNSQVYNNVAETEESIAAVKETKGQYVVYNKQPIAAYFYSTSCGSTSDVNDVWIKAEESPTYLQGHFQGEDDTDLEALVMTETWEQDKQETIKLDLSSEKNFRSFLKQENQGYEREEDWYRWNTTITQDTLTKHINENVKDGAIGEIKKIEVTERSKGGVIKKVTITGKKGKLTVTGEYQIRKVLCPKDTSMTLQNGSIRKLSMLPSGYFVIEKKKKTFVLSGGGYGHGVGLSQNGAKAMANLSYSCQEILQFYYPGTEILEEY